jgi:hypothetical protein
MEFSIEKRVSNFIQSQFPLFYQEEGPDFILFMKAYYEWMEIDRNTSGFGGPIGEARELFNYRDIDNTLEIFLEFFQKKYLYGIQFNVISNKRFLLKHILDIYRSKGTIQSYRLLFKLLYNEDIEVYLPGKDVLRVSDGTWIEPRYLEITKNDNLINYIGKTIIGASSLVTATVENYVQENYNNDIINILYISNILPKRKDFEINEKIILLEDADNTDAINLAPTLLGSLDRVSVVRSGNNYAIGDVVKVKNREVDVNAYSVGAPISFGVDGILKVSELFTGFGSLTFDLENGGFGYTRNANVFLYKTSDPGQGGSFDIGILSATRELTYNTDLICNYFNVQLDATNYGFPKNPSANLSTNVGLVLSTNTENFGTIFSLDNVLIGNSYETQVSVFVRSTLLSEPLSGTIKFANTSNVVYGIATNFSNFFSNDDIIGLQSNAAVSNSYELAVIKTVVSDNELLLYGPPKSSGETVGFVTSNSVITSDSILYTADAGVNNSISAVYRVAPTILPAEFASYEPIMFTANGSIAGENETIRAYPNFGSNIALEAVVINSGKGYVDGEQVKIYPHSIISNVVNISSRGFEYEPNERLIFVGGDPGRIASGYIDSVDKNGGILSVVIENGGSGYKDLPEIRIDSINGFGAKIVPFLLEFDEKREILAKAIKGPIGKSPGYYSTTRGFLSADKYIQDSYYYQDYSYEIKVSQTLDKYKNIINETFHSAGSELFGKYLKFLYDSSKLNLVFDEAIIFSSAWSTDSGDTVEFLVNTTKILADTNSFKVDATTVPFINYLSSDNTIVTSDNRRVVKYLYASQTDFKADNGRVIVNRYYV